MTSNKIGVNLRVSGNSNQGGRRYMEDTHATRFIRQDGKDYEFAYFGIFDGHGGPEASRFARDYLLDEITKFDAFWSENDDDIKWAIRNGFLDTHQAMWRELDKWPKTWSGLPSTAGTTASIAIIKNSKLYIGHVGDSGIVLGVDDRIPHGFDMEAMCLTKDHKPDSPEEKTRIEKCGGAVVAKSGVQRVVWSRPKVHHKGPIRRSTQIDKIPFLAVARSLGDLWSYDYFSEKFVVSPEPDVSVHCLDPQKHKFLILASDGLWNMLRPEESVSLVSELEMHFEERVINDMTVPLSYWVNPAERLVTKALNKWQARMMKADNTSAIVVLIDPLGPSKLSLLRKKREERHRARTGWTPTAGSSGTHVKPGGKPCSVVPAIDSSLAHSSHTNLHTAPHKGGAAVEKVTSSGGSDSKSTNEDKLSIERNKVAKKSGAPAETLDDSVQLLSSLNNVPVSSPSLSLPSLKTNSFTALKGAATPTKRLDDRKYRPWSVSKSPSLRSVGIVQTGAENVQTRTRSGRLTPGSPLSMGPAPGVLCQQKMHANSDKNMGSRDRFDSVLKPSRFQMGDGNTRKARTIRRRQEFVTKLEEINKESSSAVKRKQDFVKKLEEVNKNNSNSNSMGSSFPAKKTRNPQGIVPKTRRTLRKAKNAAKRAMCLENTIFLKRRRNQGSPKRKMDDAVVGPVAKRLRRSYVPSLTL